MGSNEFGLPLEYQIMPQYFDAHNILDDSTDKNAALAALLKETNVSSILDMTCGTGAQVFYLTDLGYQVTGSDFSPDLLVQARQKAQDRNLDIDFIDGDMRNLKVGQFDAVITMFNAIGHLSKPDFEIAIRNVADNLKPNGLYIFDIFNVEAITDENIGPVFDMDITKAVGSTTIRNIQTSKLDRKLNQLTSFDHYIIEEENGDLKERDHHFTLQIYTATEIAAMLAANGFDQIEQFDFMGGKFSPTQSHSILTCAHKSAKSA